MNNLAPVILFVYNRLDETRSTIDALKSNFLAKESTLYIFSDATKKNTSDTNVLRVRKYIKTIDGFKNVVIIERDENFGLAKSIIEGVSEIIKKFGKVIVLEDDLVTSKNFLCYMNQSLVAYKDREDIFSISGYTGALPSLKKYNSSTYLSYRPSSWGWATWVDQWKNIDWDIKDYDKFIENREETKKFNRGGVDMTRMLKHYKEGKNRSWAIRWAYAMYRENKLCIYPSISKIQNIGFGKNATHCVGINIYKTTLDLTSLCDFEFSQEKEPNTQLVKEFKYQYSYTNKLIKKSLNFFVSNR
ncbi:MAG: sugar transferase [SAR324 cluster bacterium]|uniref:Sugar transferase n=1 Tax=SAR324 cluster bacterium TaxID=2024889 RepID=A0A2A4T3I5_9DELT|nr:MAG: sugar transferase [SAR324 cluster bacterium]